jgi:hypothetical protein
MKTILFTNARDENNILEWTIHHLNLGFTYIYIYDHKSIMPIKNIIKNINNVHIERIDTDNICKADLNRNAVEFAKNKNYDWLLYLDADEFLILPNDNHLFTFLHKFNNYDQIGINWLLFGSNYHNKEPNGTLLENYTKCNDTLDLHIKSFVRPSQVVSIPNPHAYFIKNMSLSVGTNYKVLNKDAPYFFNYDNIDDINKINAYVAHHIFQSYETFTKRKCNRTRDDSNESWGFLFDENTLHSKHNNVENMFPMNKYNEKNKKMMNM